MKNLNVLKDDSHYHSHGNALLLFLFIAPIVQRTFNLFPFTDFLSSIGAAKLQAFLTLATLFKKFFNFFFAALQSLNELPCLQHPVRELGLQKYTLLHYLQTFSENFSRIFL